MPTSRRSWARAALPGRPTSWPQTSIVPPWIVSRPAMQRSRVLLPEPLRPTMATVWPSATSKPTPSRTRSAPNSLVTSLIRTMAASVPLSADIGIPLERARGERQRVAQGEVDGADDDEDDEGLEGRIVDDLARAREFDEADHRGERRVLHDLHHETHRRRNGDAHRLRQHDIGILLEAVEAQAIRRLPLGARHGLDAAAPDLAQEGRGVEREGDAGGYQRRQLVAHDAEPEVRQEQHDQQRCPLDQLDIGTGHKAQRCDLR